MQILPAIDLQYGRCVRLLRGEFDAETVFDDDPVAVARRWKREGADMVHVVDLDGARGGRPVQQELIRSIAALVPVQVGGGLRTREDVAATLAFAARAVIGTAALEPGLVKQLVEAHGDRLVVALDSRDDLVATDGWTRTSSRTVLELAHELHGLGVQWFLHTDVERDGTLTSPNFESLERLTALGARVIASGGVSRAEDITRLRQTGAAGVIVGRALYVGSITLSEAIRCAG